MCIMRSARHARCSYDTICSKNTIYSGTEYEQKVEDFSVKIHIRGTGVWDIRLGLIVHDR